MDALKGYNYDSDSSSSSEGGKKDAGVNVISHVTPKNDSDNNNSTDVSGISVTTSSTSFGSTSLSSLLNGPKISVAPKTLATTGFEPLPSEIARAGLDNSKSLASNSMSNSNSNSNSNCNSNKAIMVAGRNSNHNDNIKGVNAKVSAISGRTIGPSHPHLPGFTSSSAVAFPAMNQNRGNGQNNGLHNTRGVAEAVSVDPDEFEGRLYGRDAGSAKINNSSNYINNNNNNNKRAPRGKTSNGNDNDGETNRPLDSKPKRRRRPVVDPWGNSKNPAPSVDNGNNDNNNNSNNNDASSILTEAQKRFLLSSGFSADGTSSSSSSGDAGGRGSSGKSSEKPGASTSIFHGDSETDFAGYTYMRPPRDGKTSKSHDPSSMECRVPRAVSRTLNGHSKGVSRVRFFPRHGHLLLSASMDNTVKIWDIHESRGKCLRTFTAHSKAVRDVCFNRDGTRFLSASFDKNVLLWDTETGAVIAEFKNAKPPAVARLNPGDEAGHEFLAAVGKDIVQWDTREKRSVQTYSRHLTHVNTVSFFDEGRKFVSSSDDKSLRVWEYGIPVEVRTISEPWMGSMPSVSSHPNNKFMLATSLDNQVLIYHTEPRFKLHKKKRFVGHKIAGYACETVVSPDGQFVCSGDAEGGVFFWNWGNAKIARKFKAHAQVAITADWSPARESMVATGSWDGTVKVWE